MGYIQLRTEIPGPKSRELLERRARAVSRGLAQANPIAVARAHGALVEDVDGNLLVDLAGGIGALAVGHTPERVVEAIQAQAERLIHMCAIVANYEPYVALAEALNALYPGPGPAKTLLANGGAEAVENAVKLARAYTGRAAVMVFEGAYHGRTNLTMAMTSKYALFKKGFGPFAPEVYRLPVPNLYRTPPGMTEEEYLDWSLWNLENALVAHIDGSALAAIVIEPVLGEGGFIPVPHAFLRKLREIADRTGALLIADEVQSGSGRTGRMWAIEHSGVVPDLIVSAKSLGAGMPISAVTGRAEVLDAPHVGGVGSTYGGNPLAAVAALEALRILRSPGFMERASLIEATVRRVFTPLKEAVPALGDVRGLGAMMALEFVKDPRTKEPWPEFVLELVRRNAERGVITIRAGLYSNALRFLPPLDIPLDMLEEALSVVAENIREVYAKLA
ncbi:aspartate aminotransferase family protein [Thermus igniterrae]|jgi:4-aminobutyrate aminotransferase/(S)-3-amino-2-methylpropionate transaminase|uniref:aspartate aminotransferase family protein n=1 Tax=Thermus igniterrae TaxID=88189 RepID=UPI00035CD268|nr:aminotransferase class III-fold pyridoxal phosphate-dependent enzyme [Thermus igniterrae]